MIYTAPKPPKNIYKEEFSDLVFDFSIQQYTIVIVEKGKLLATKTLPEPTANSIRILSNKKRGIKITGYFGSKPFPDGHWMKLTYDGSPLNSTCGYTYQGIYPYTLQFCLSPLIELFKSVPQVIYFKFT